MRTINTVFAMLLGVSVSLPVNAVETNTEEAVHKTHQVHFLGKRAYHQPVVAKSDAEQAWVGATLRVDQTNSQQTMRMNALAKRAY